MRIYNLIWTPEELRNNKLTPLNKDNLKSILFQYRRRK